jgi:hypothetical protein
MDNGKSLRSPLGRARGLGSAKDGTHHWWAQRVTAIALVPLVLWFVVSAIGLAGASHAAALAWIGQINRAHLDRHAVPVRQPFGQIRQNLGATSSDDQMVTAGGELGCKRRADAL